MSSEKDSCAKTPHNKLHKKLHKSSTPPIIYNLKSLGEIKAKIITHIYNCPTVTGSQIVDEMISPIRGYGRRNLFSHINQLYEMGIIDRINLKKPFMLQLSWLGKRVVQLNSGRVKDSTYVRLEKTFIEFSIKETDPYGDKLEEFKNNILLKHKWGKAKTTFLNWLKIIVTSRFPFFVGGTLEFRFGKNKGPKFRLYLTANEGFTAQEAQYRAVNQAMHLTNRYRIEFFKVGLELTDDVFSWEGLNEKGLMPEYESPAPVDLGKRIKVQKEDNDYWIDESKGFPEWGTRQIHQATRLFTLPNQLDEIKEELVQLRAENYRMLKIIELLEKKLNKGDENESK